MKDIKLSISIPKVVVFGAIVLQIALIVVKLLHIAAWSWLIILLPLFTAILFVIFTILVGFMCCFYIAKIQDENDGGNYDG